MIREAIFQLVPPPGIQRYCETVNGHPHLIFTVEGRFKSVRQNNGFDCVDPWADDIVRTQRIAITLEKVGDSVTVSMDGHDLFKQARLTHDPDRLAGALSNPEPQLLAQMIVRPGEPVRQDIMRFVDDVMETFGKYGRNFDAITADTSRLFGASLDGLLVRRPDHRPDVPTQSGGLKAA